MLGWVMSDLSKSAEPRMRLVMAGGAVLGGFAFQYAASCMRCWILDRSKISASTLPIGKPENEKKTYAKIKFEAPENAPPRVLVAATGSVATVKVPEIVISLLHELEQGAEVKVLLSGCGEKMLAISGLYNEAAWREMKTRGVEMLTDDDEWYSPTCLLVSASAIASIAELSALEKQSPSHHFQPASLGIPASLLRFPDAACALCQGRLRKRETGLRRSHRAQTMGRLRGRSPVLRAHSRQGG